ncbi:hypothetical protein ACFL2S_06650 [Thermodesulfobacteriota bacterium]
MNAGHTGDSWGTRSGVDRRQDNMAIDIPDRRVKTERRCGRDRRRLLYLKYRVELDLRQAFRNLG